MLKKMLALTTVLLLLAPVALAMGPQGGLQGGRNRTAAPGMGQGLGLQLGQGFGLRQGQGLGPMARTKLQEDPAALKERMLARHDEMVKRAQELLADKANLPAKIVNDLVSAQARALAIAEERAKEATDTLAASQRLARFKEHQERVLASVRENAEQIAAKKIEQAEKVLSNAAEVRASIESGERLEQFTGRLAKMRQRKNSSR